MLESLFVKAIVSVGGNSKTISWVTLSRSVPRLHFYSDNDHCLGTLLSG